MERKQGFFSALKEEVVRGLSPGRSRGRSPSPSGSGLLRRRRASHAPPPDVYISRSGSLRPGGVETLSPLMEGPDPNASECGGDSKSEKWGHWMKGQLCRAPSVSVSGSSFQQRSDLRLLLGVLGAPLAPVHVSNNDPLPHLSIKGCAIPSFFQKFHQTSIDQQHHTTIPQSTTCRAITTSESHVSVYLFPPSLMIAISRAY